MPGPGASSRRPITPNDGHRPIGQALPNGRSARHYSSESARRVPLRLSGPALLALKLSLVPLFLMLVTLAGRRYGPGVAGWLAGLPVVAGPILYFIALENGPAFASAAAASSTSAVFASVSFSVAYAHLAQRHDWPVALLLAVLA